MAIKLGIKGSKVVGLKFAFIFAPIQSELTAPAGIPNHPCPLIILTHRQSRSLNRTLRDRLKHLSGDNVRLSCSGLPVSVTVLGSRCFRSPVALHIYQITTAESAKVSLGALHLGLVGLVQFLPSAVFLRYRPVISPINSERRRIVQLTLTIQCRSRLRFSPV